MDELLSSTKKVPEFYNHLGCARHSTVRFEFNDMYIFMFQIEQITAEYRARVRDCHPDKAGTAANNSFLQLQVIFFDFIFNNFLIIIQYNFVLSNAE